ncbi:DUF6894 family protein [Lichenibacterium ramalinae]|jgi:hypothetical protein|uniref:DUF6894 family protein n=1 Tax=Lichenibacterium ramalinae TaxID=2316527 RepID=UPI003D166F41
MPRYFFNIIDGYSSLDDRGTELRDIYEAHEASIRLSGEILREMGGKFWNGTQWKLEVTDEKGAILFTLRFSAEEAPLPIKRPKAS